MLNKIVGKNMVYTLLFKVFKQGFFAQINHPINPRKISPAIYVNESLPVVISTTDI